MNLAEFLSIDPLNIETSGEAFGKMFATFGNWLDERESIEVETLIGDHVQKFQQVRKALKAIEDDSWIHEVGYKPGIQTHNPILSAIYMEYGYYGWLRIAKAWSLIDRQLHPHFVSEYAGQIENLYQKLVWAFPDPENVNKGDFVKIILQSEMFSLYESGLSINFDDVIDDKNGGMHSVEAIVFGPDLLRDDFDIQDFGIDILGKELLINYWNIKTENSKPKKSKLIAQRFHKIINSYGTED